MQPSVIRILELAKSKGISNQEICRIIGANRNKVDDWKKEKSSPTNNEMVTLANRFGVTTDYLLGNAVTANDITFDDFTYAMHNESKDLSDEEKEMLLDMARVFQAKRRERDGQAN